MSARARSTMNDTKRPGWAKRWAFSASIHQTRPWFGKSSRFGAPPVLEDERLKCAERVLYARGRRHLKRSLGHDADNSVSDLDLAHQEIPPRKWGRRRYCPPGSVGRSCGRSLMPGAPRGVYHSGNPPPQPGRRPRNAGGVTPRRTGVVAEPFGLTASTPAACSASRCGSNDWEPSVFETRA